MKYPRSVSRLAGLICGLSFLSSLLLPGLEAAPRISEFMAINDRTLRDEDGATSDWIEIENPDVAPLSMKGWYLTDNQEDPTKWQFPDVTIPPNGFLLVFASNKDRTNPDSELHTNFTLRGDGEYLALVQPDGTTIASSYEPPAQFKDLSFGVGSIGATLSSQPVAMGTQAKYHVPTSDIGTGWRMPEFDDAAWTSAGLAFGFDNSGPYLDLLGEGGDIAEATKGVSASVYVRAAFEIPNPSDVLRMALALNWEDGVVGWLNGEQILAENAPSPLEWDSEATSSHSDSDSDAIIPSTYELDISGKLVAGTNVLAFQVMNTSRGGSDLLLLPVLSIESKDSSAGEAEGFFEEPSPGTPNGAGKLPPAYVEITPSTKAFVEDSIQVTIASADENAVIRYTTDGSAPTNDIADPSPEYAGPITVDTSTQVRARAFLPGSLDGPIQTEAYFKLEEGTAEDPDAAEFTSNLPIVLIDSFGNRRVPSAGSTSRLPMMMAIFEPKAVEGDENPPRASMLNPPDLVTRIGIRKRGSSSGGWPKNHFSVEAWTENDWEEKDIEPFGFGADDDWILGSFYQFDRALIRNPYIYDISRQIGRFAARTKHVELYNNLTGDVGGNDYFGVYTLGERLDRGRTRIDVDSLNETFNEEPEVTGGYIFKRDRGSPTFSGGRMGSFVYVYPDGARDRNRPDDFFITSEQKSWLQSHMREIGDALRDRDGVHPDTGKHFTEYIDVGSFIDHVILNALAMNVDWGRLSAWLYLPREGKLQGGPIWDFDRNMGSEDGRDSNPEVWDGSGDSSKTWYDSRYPYYGQVLGFSGSTAQGPPRRNSSNPDIFQQWVDRWFDLRKGPLSTENLLATVDKLADPLSEAAPRNFDRWRAVRPNGGRYSGGDRSWEGEVKHMKGWLERRANWMDDQFPDPPVFNIPGGSVPAGTEFTMTFKKGSGYYTTDGSDPRMPGGEISPTAKQFEGGAINTTLVPTDAPANYTIPTDGSLAATWTEAEFDDAAWTEAATGIGWETAGGTLEPEIKTNISEQLRNVNAGAYFRWNFEFDNANNVNGATLKVQSDDGFVAYLNGVKVGELNAPDPVQWDSKATSSNNDSKAVEGLEIDISDVNGLFRNGRNVLAIHAMNTSAGGSDFLIKAGLDVNQTVVPNPVTLNASQTITARTFDGEFWSAPTRHPFAIGATPASAANIVIAELMYHPPNPSSQERGTNLSNEDFFEFAELLNTSANTVDLTGVSFTSGILFTFPDGTYITPGQRLLVVNNKRAFQERYGHSMDHAIAGEVKDTQFANGGELVELKDANQATIQMFTYGDSAPWPEEPDGNGFSLVLISPESSPDHNVAANWTIGEEFGTPGFGEETGGTTFTGDPGADNDNDGLNAFAEYALGTSEQDGASGPGAVQVTSGDSGNVVMTFPVNTAAIDVSFIVEITTDLQNWTEAGVQKVGESPNGENRALVSYRSDLPDASEAYMRVRILQK